MNDTGEEELRAAVMLLQGGTDDARNDMDWQKFMQLIKAYGLKQRLDELECAGVPGYFFWNKGDVSMTIDDRIAALKKGTGTSNE